MKKKMTSNGPRAILLVTAILLMAGCTQVAEQQDQVSDPLPSWNEGAVKTAIRDFVKSSVDPQGEGFIPGPDRIAVFDNDGTLWAENPLYFQFYFAMDRIREMAPEHPEWNDMQPFRAVIEGDNETLMSLGNEALTKMVVTAHTGTTSDEFSSIVKHWIETARHPTLDRPYTDLVYQPMLELLDYLRANEFKTFIVSGGGIDFMRVFTEEVYGIPEDQVVGTSMKTEFIWDGEEGHIKRLSELNFFNDKEGKPVAIDRHIGRRPVFCAGNSDGDLAMMQYTASGGGPRFMLYVHHTDGNREWDYDRESHVGHFDKALDEASEKGWTLMDMARDWKVVFPFEL